MPRSTTPSVPKSSRRAGTPVPKDGRKVRAGAKPNGDKPDEHTDENESKLNKTVITLDGAADDNSEHGDTHGDNELDTTIEAAIEAVETAKEMTKDNALPTQATLSEVNKSTETVEPVVQLEDKKSTETAEPVKQLEDKESTEQLPEQSADKPPSQTLDLSISDTEMLSQPMLPASQIDGKPPQSMKDVLKLRTATEVT